MTKECREHIANLFPSLSLPELLRQMEAFLRSELLYTTWFYFVQFLCDDGRDMRVWGYACGNVCMEESLWGEECVLEREVLIYFLSITLKKPRDLPFGVNRIDLDTQKPLFCEYTIPDRSGVCFSLSLSLCGTFLTHPHLHKCNILATSRCGMW